jgi:hypothetical protein
MKTTHLKWIAISLSTLMLMQSCKVYNGNGSITGQSQTSERSLKYYMVRVKKKDGMRYKGILYSADKIGVYVTGTLGDSGYLIKPNEIETIKIRRKGKVLMSSGIGLLSGAVTGFIIGIAGGDDPPCIPRGPFDCLFYVEMTAIEKGTGAAILLAVPGAIIGALVGTRSEIFKINGNSEIYLTYLKKLDEYTLVKQIE